jgi:hypothetical protein
LLELQNNGQPYLRKGEIMAREFTPEQKESIDALLAFSASLDELSLEEWIEQYTSIDSFLEGQKKD